MITIGVFILSPIGLRFYHSVMQLAPRRPSALLIVVAALSSGCGEVHPPAPSAPPPPPTLFVDRTRDAGLSFVHMESRGGKVSFLPQTLGPGLAAIDYDNDGWTDLYFVQGSGDGGPRPPSHLYRAAGPSAPYREVAGKAGAGLTGFGQSVLVFDHDNDGYQDMLVTRYREKPALLMNMGDGTFRETATAAGLTRDDGWDSFATALDHDRDGDLDLYIGRYVTFKAEDWVENSPIERTDRGSFPRTMLPRPYPPEKNLFYANRGNGSFEDVTEVSGTADPLGRGMGALAADFDDDGWMDLFVANDVSPCVLLANQKNGTFKDIARNAWVAESRGSMGIALWDWNLDHRLDIVVTHWLGDPPALYESQGVRQGTPVFADRATRAGLDRIPGSMVGWAVGTMDLENDGVEELFIVNGHTNSEGMDGRLAPQEVLLFQRTEGGVCRMVTPAGPEDPLARRRVGRSAVFVDFDRDGSKDVAIGNNNEPGELWMAHRSEGAWLGLELVGTAGNRDAIGARVELVDGAGKVVALQQRVSGDSFFASQEIRHLFGLGSSHEARTVRIRWPSGAMETFAGLLPQRYHRLVEGTARPAPGAPGAGAS